MPKQYNQLLLGAFIISFYSTPACAMEGSLLDSADLPIHNVPPLLPPPPREQIESLITPKIGHGIRTPEGIPPQKIETLLDKYKTHPVLRKAFDIIAGADLAITHDQKILLNSIREHPHLTINADDLITVMERDRDLITQAAHLFDPADAHRTRYLPFLDQLHVLGNQQAICGHSYVGRKGIDEAIILLRNNFKSLARGHIPDELRNRTGKESIVLRIALFYLAKAKKQIMGENYGPSHLTTFYKGEYFGSNQSVKELLSETSFYENDFFFTPDNGYVKNADSAVDIPFDSQEPVVSLTNEYSLNHLKMVFTDCSGFAQSVVRLLHPANMGLKERVMSYHLAALYDALTNEQEGTTGVLYDLDGRNNRPLKQYESEYVNKYKEKIEQLKNAFSPVLNPMQNMQPGDILVEQGANAAAEGHVMIVAEQNLNTPTCVTIVELSGINRGYRWRDIDLRNDTNKRFHRVLRIKNQS